MSGPTQMTEAQARASVNQAICMVILPDLYQLINDVVSASGGPLPKALILRLRKSLPAKYPNSISSRGDFL